MGWCILLNRSLSAMCLATATATNNSDKINSKCINNFVCICSSYESTIYIAREEIGPMSIGPTVQVQCCFTSTGTIGTGSAGRSTLYYAGMGMHPHSNKKASLFIPVFLRPEEPDSGAVIHPATK